MAHFAQLSAGGLPGLDRHERIATLLPGAASGNDQRLGGRAGPAAGADSERIGQRPHVVGHGHIVPTAASSAASNTISTTTSAPKLTKVVVSAGAAGRPGLGDLASRAVPVTVA